MADTLTRPKPEPAYRRDPKQKRHQLVAAARALFAAQGYDATSTVQIAERAGVSEGILFHHFGSKRGLFAQLAEEFSREAAAATMPNDPTQMTEASIVRSAFAFAEKNPALYRLFLEDGPKLAVSDATTITNVVVSVIQKNLERGMEQNKVRHGDARVMAELQFAVVDGAYKAWRNSNNPARKEDYIVEAIRSMTAMLAPTIS
jgi:AcrR family transcriptional regulator